MALMIGAVLAASIPGFLWLWHFYKKDKYEPEPVSLVLKCVMFGALAVIPIALIEWILEKLVLQGIIGPLFQLNPYYMATGYLAIGFRSFIEASFTEELGKFFVVYKTVFNNPEFNEIMDGIIYSTAAAVGFSIAENFLYIWATNFNPLVMLLRSTCCTVIHISASGFFGYYLARAKFVDSPPARKYYIGLGLGIAIGIHGIYDFVILSSVTSPGAGLAVLGFIILSAFAFYRLLNDKVDLALAESPFRPGAIQADALRASVREVGAAAGVGAARDRSGAPEQMFSPALSASLSGPQRPPASPKPAIKPIGAVAPLQAPANPVLRAKSGLDAPGMSQSAPAQAGSSPGVVDIAANLADASGGAPQRKSCPRCKYKNPSEALQCRVCKQPLVSSPPVSGPPRSAPSPGSPSSGSQPRTSNDTPPGVVPPADAPRR
jgi:protease PrsW